MVTSDWVKCVEKQDSGLGNIGLLRGGHFRGLDSTVLCLMVGIEIKNGELCWFEVHPSPATGNFPIVNSKVHSMILYVECLRYYALNPVEPSKFK